MIQSRNKSFRIFQDLGRLLYSGHNFFSHLCITIKSNVFHSITTLWSCLYCVTKTSAPVRQFVYKCEWLLDISLLKVL